MHLCSAFMERGNFILSQNFVSFFFGITPVGVMVRPWKSTFFLPKWHLAMESFDSAFSKHSKTVHERLINLSSEFLAAAMSLTFCAHWPASLTGSKFSPINL